MRRALPILLLSLAILPLAAQAKARTKAKPKPAPDAQAAAVQPAPAPKVKPRVRLETSCGPIVVELEPDAAPRTVENFLRYVREGHYKDTIFHRVIPGFMIQGGGHRADLSEKPTHAPIPNEAPEAARAGLRNTRGTLAMARTEDPHSAAAQFYINVADNPSLDNRSLRPDGYGYCPFGRVVEGMEAVGQIERVRTVWMKGLRDVPEYPVMIKGAEVLPEK